MLDPEIQRAIEAAVSSSIARLERDLSDRLAPLRQRQELLETNQESLKRRAEATSRDTEQRLRLFRLQLKLGADARLDTETANENFERLREWRSSLREPATSKSLRSREQPPAESAAWYATLSTAGGAGAVAQALASHLRESLTPRGPRDATADSVRHDTSLVKIAETLEACSARLQEFKPSGAADVDLAPLGSQPFVAATQANLYCSFCAKAQKEVARLIAGPCVYICNECVELSRSILEEEQT